MQFTSFNDFIAMGGHGFYVWLAFGISSLLLGLLVFATFAKDKQIKQQILKRLQREQKLKQAAQQQAANTSNNGSLNQAVEEASS